MVDGSNPTRHVLFIYFFLKFYFYFFVCFDALRPRQQIFSHIGTISCFYGKQCVSKVTPACFSQHTGGTAYAVANVLDCDSRDPVLVEICSRNNFYGHPFPSAISIRAAICFMRKCVLSILIFPGTVCVDRLTHFCPLEYSIRSNWRVDM